MGCCTMNRLPFQLHDFSRVIWHSAAARDRWEPRISKINQVWGRVERQAVVEGLRDSCLTFFSPEQLPEAAAWAAVRGLVVLPLSQVGVATQYSATPQAVQSGKPWQYRAVLADPKAMLVWAMVWGQPDSNPTIGSLLGYPKCCTEFFERVWVQDKCVDTTWEMARNTQGAEDRMVDPSTIRIPAMHSTKCPEANILLRWLGVRLVPHLPCSFGCLSTVDNGLMFADLIRADTPDVAEWIYEVLDWPVEWTALHGIAEVRTPILTISTRTDATPNKYVVQREGFSYPEEGSNGLNFPFRIVTGKVTSKPSFQRSFTNIHELNGFGSEAAMVAAHDVLLSVLPEKPGFLLDLGCGTGRFLERASELGWSVAGVEIDNARAGAGTIPIRRGDIMDVRTWEVPVGSPPYDVVAFMPGRLMEGAEGANSLGADNVRAALRTRGKAVLLYAYGDWLEKYGNLVSLVAAAGLSYSAVKFQHAVASPGVEAMLVQYAPQLMIAEVAG